MFFPAVIAAAADGAVALGRIGKFLTAEELAEAYTISQESKYAIDVDGDFKWETAFKLGSQGPKFDHGKAKEGPAKEKAPPNARARISLGLFRKKEKGPVLSMTTDDVPKEDIKGSEDQKDEEKPFELTDLKLQIPKGSFVAIVGRVGSGKVRFVVI